MIELYPSYIPGSLERVEIDAMIDRAAERWPSVAAYTEAMLQYAAAECAEDASEGPLAAPPADIPTSACRAQ